MDLEYQSVNVDDGNESTLLHFTMGDDGDVHVLLDSGAGVDVDEHLLDEESLDAICLTHAHIDHYRSLPQNTRPDVPIYTSPDTATILEHTLPEAARHDIVGDVNAALDLVSPIDEWETITEQVAVRPISVGHTPGAVGFLFRFTDERLDGELLPSTKFVLATGDFTLRSCAGYAGISESFPEEIDALLLNVSTDDDFESNLNDGLEVLLERAYGGSRVVVATGALTGVHVATLLDAVVDEIGRDIPIRLVGQAAKHYHSLGYDCSAVETVPTFDDPMTVLEDGGITIGGPETGTNGSTERLVQAIDENPNATLVQLTTGSTDPISTSACSTHQLPLVNHPPLDRLEEFVDTVAPIQVVVKHAMGQTLNRFQKRFDQSFTWGTDDRLRHTLYTESEWVAPTWIRDDTAKRIRMRHRNAQQDKPFTPNRSFDALTHGPIDPEAEGVNVDRFCDKFSATGVIAEGQAASLVDDTPTDEAVPEAPTREASSEATPDASVDSNPEMADESAPENPITLDEAEVSPSDEEDEDSTDDSFEETVLSRLDDIEAHLDDSNPPVTARVLSGDGDTFLQILDDTDLDAGDLVELQISLVDADDDRSSS